MTENQLRTGTRTQTRLAQLCLSVLFLTFMIPAAEVCAISPQFGRRPAPVDDDDVELMVATLKTDPELEQLLEQAERFKDDGNYRFATQLWQAVLERSGDTLYSADDQTYFSLSRQVETVLAGLPPDGLESYRVTADANAREILAAAGDENDVEALNRVVREYFVSSVGDDTAFRLGCLYLDRHDFTGARRMFEKILNSYPDPSMPLEQIHVRIAVCQSFLGEPDLAALSLEEAARLGGSNASSQIDQVRGWRPGLAVADHRAGDGAWRMPMGNAARQGVMRDLPDSVMDSKRVARWQYYVEPRQIYEQSSDTVGDILVGKDAHRDVAESTQVRTEKELIKSWREKHWNPAGGLLVDDGRIYFKSAADVIAWNLADIEKQISDGEGKLKKSWRSVWRNSFEMDDASKVLQSVKTSFRGFSDRNRTKFSDAEPAAPVEVQFFGDRIFQQMSIHDGKLFTIEGHEFDDEIRTKPKKMNAQWDISIRRTRSNFLTAYDAESGVLLWRLPKQETAPGAEPMPLAEPDNQPFLESGGFMSAPVGFGRMIIGAVNQGGAISVYAFDPNDEGRTIWKSFLCDEPETGAAPWSSIDLSIDGSDLFVSCGMGVVFALDPSTGMVRFARRYARTAGKRDEAFRKLGWNNPRMTFHGWSNDVIIPYGRQMICFSSDTNQVDAFDRNSGELIWYAELAELTSKVDYLLGVYDNMLYAAGPETVVAFDLLGEGRMVWGGEKLFDGKIATGRGMLTPNGIYMPVDDTIYKFDPHHSGQRVKQLGKVEVDLGTTAPLGNLFSDGNRFWVHGGNRLYALGEDGKNGKNN